MDSDDDDDWLSQCDAILFPLGHSFCHFLTRYNFSFTTKNVKDLKEIISSKKFSIRLSRNSYSIALIGFDFQLTPSPQLHLNHADQSHLPRLNKSNPLPSRSLHWKPVCFDEILEPCLLIISSVSGKVLKHMREAKPNFFDQRNGKCSKRLES